MNVLVVDDEAFQRELLVRAVEGFNHRVAQAKDAAEALEKMKSERYDLYLMDVYLPDMSALELIPVMRALRPGARIAVMTGQSSRELERRLRELGIISYLARPYQQVDLRNLLAHTAANIPPAASSSEQPEHSH